MNWDGLTEYSIDFFWQPHDISEREFLSKPSLSSLSPQPSHDVKPSNFHISNLSDILQAKATSAKLLETTFRDAIFPVCLYIFL